MQGFGRLGKAAVIDDGLQGSPLIQGDTGRFHGGGLGVNGVRSSLVRGCELINWFD
ncbi:hypothetical protein D3C77_698690 [compost metagenome]